MATARFPDVPAIHVLRRGTEDVDARDKPGHDGDGAWKYETPLFARMTAERVARMSVSDMRGGSGPGCRFAHPGYALTSSAAPGAAQNATRRPPLALAVRLWSDIAMPSMAPNTATFALVW